MSICDRCGTSFDEEEAADEFQSEYCILNYDNIRMCLCGECACKAIDNMDEDVYFETCENCGSTFDYIVDQCTFSNHFPGASLIDYWDSKILCADCAIEEAEENDND